jgi:predicted metal-dependent phosphoesterase TrpH
MRRPPTTFDLHVHTSRHSPDSVINAFSLVRRVAALGLTGVVITEHDHQWSEEELDELRAATPHVQVYAGVEVSTADGHFLCYGLTDATRTPPGIGVADLCAEVHRQGGVVVAAHPYRWGQDFDAILRDADPALDGLELMSNNMDEPLRVRALELWKTRRWAGLGNSDAHEEGIIGKCYTEFDHAVRDLRDLVEAIRSGQTTAMAREEVQLFD